MGDGGSTRAIGERGGALRKAPRFGTHTPHDAATRNTMRFVFSVGSDLVSGPGFERPDVVTSLTRYADALADAVRDEWPDAAVTWTVDARTGYTVQWHTVPSDDHVERCRELADAVWEDSQTWYVDERQSALAAHLQCGVGDVTGRGDEWSCGRQEWIVLNEAEADERAAEAVRDSLWAFRPEFIADHTSPRLNTAATKALAEIQRKLCEDAAPLIEALVDDMDSFIQDAISADGRGHFLASYDHEENEENGWYLYRVG